MYGSSQKTRTYVSRGIVSLLASLGLFMICGECWPHLRPLDAPFSGMQAPQGFEGGIQALFQVLLRAGLIFVWLYVLDPRSDIGNPGRWVGPDGWRIPPRRNEIRESDDEGTPPQEPPKE